MELPNIYGGKAISNKYVAPYICDQVYIHYKTHRFTRILKKVYPDQNYIGLKLKTMLTVHHWGKVYVLICTTGSTDCTVKKILELLAN